MKKKTLYFEAKSFESSHTLLFHSYSSIKHKVDNWVYTHETYKENSYGPAEKCFKKKKETKKWIDKMKIIYPSFKLLLEFDKVEKCLIYPLCLIFSSIFNIQ